MGYRTSAAASILFLAASPVLAGDIESAAVSANLSWGYGPVPDEPMQGVLELLPSAELNFEGNASLVASARLRLDAYDELVPGRAPSGNYSELSRPLLLGDAGSAEIRRLFLEFHGRNGITRIGRQQIVWGRLDGIKVLDVVNPQDFREFILDDFGDSRIGLWSAYFDYSVGGWRAELALVPDGTGHTIPEPGAWFELRAPRFRFGASPEAEIPRTETEQPGNGIDAGAAGLRLSRRFERLAVSAVAYTGLDPEPVGRVILHGGEPRIERYQERRDVFGVSAETSVGRFVLRAEYAIQPDRVFNVRNAAVLGTVPLDQHRAAAGVDIDGPFDIFVNLQYLVDRVADAPAGLVRPDHDEISTVFLRRSFAYDRLTAEARWYHSHTDGDDLFAAAVEYDVNDRSSLRLSADVFDGTAVGLFGQFADRDRVTLALEHTF